VAGTLDPDEAFRELNAAFDRIIGIDYSRRGIWLRRKKRWLSHLAKITSHE
jgi:hypothetical protein